MEEKNETRTSGGKIKAILGGLSLLIVFSTPYLNITQLSLNMNLLQSAVYSFILFSFWIIAGAILRQRKPTIDLIDTPTTDQYHQPQHKPMATV